MATQKDNEKKVKKEDSAAHPPGWPNMPGRSEDHERHAGQGRDADVTEQQRDLEKTTRR